MTDMSQAPDPNADAASADDDSNEKTVCISCTTDPATGQMTYAIGLQPPDDDSDAGGGAPAAPGAPPGGEGDEGDESWMSPVHNLAAALSAAKDLLTNSQVNPGDEQQFTKGYDAQSGKPPTMSTAGMV